MLFATNVYVTIIAFHVYVIIIAFHSERLSSLEDDALLWPNNRTELRTDHESDAYTSFCSPFTRAHLNSYSTSTIVTLFEIFLSVRELCAVSSNLQSSEPFYYLTDWSVNYIQGISPWTWLFHRETFRSHYRRRFYKADTMTSKGIGFDVFFYGFIEVFLFFFDQVVMPFVFMIALPEMVAQTVFHGCNLIRNLLPNCLTSPWRMFQQFRSYLLTPTVENLGPLSLDGRNIHEH